MLVFGGVIPWSETGASKDILSLLASVPTQSEPWIEPRPGWKDDYDDFWEGEMGLAATPKIQGVDYRRV